MKTLISGVSLLLAAVLFYAFAREGERTAHFEFFDPMFNQLIDTSAQFEVIGEGYAWSEGPVWVEEQQILLFSDLPNNVIYKWKDGEGITEYLKPAGYTGQQQRGGQKGSNGLILGRNESLIIAQHGDRRIARMDAPLTSPKPNFVTITDSFNDKKLNSPNDLVQHSNGGIYFTDPPYGIEEGNGDQSQQLAFQGVYYLAPSGKLHLVTDKLSRPNGIALSPDERTLYVSNSDRSNPVWMAFDVHTDGLTSNGRIFMDASGIEGPGVPDGMTVDLMGNIYATGPGGIWVMSSEGKVLGHIKMTKAVSNCKIGNNGKILYVTGGNRVLRIPLK